MQTLPFLPEFRNLLKTGKKTMTARNKRYGRPGDVLATSFPGLYVRLKDVRRVRLVTVAELHFREEGVESPEAFIEIWNRIHPAKGYQAHQAVWLHELEAFERADPFVPRQDPQARLGTA